MAHTSFTESLRQLHAGFERDGLQSTTAQTAMTIVNEWLEDHIGLIDTQLRPLVENGDG